MHLLQAQPGEIADGTEPVDPQQTPADLVVISAADTELAALSAARAELEPAAPSLRLASLGWLTHPFSVDLYLDQTACRSRLVVARVLGGEAYWPYGLEQFAARLRAAGVLFAALPGDDKPDESLFAASSVDREDCQRLWAYLVEGGPANARAFLIHCRRLLGEGEPAPAPAPLLRAGLYWPGAEGALDLDGLRRLQPNPDAPVVALVFYRALLQGAGLQPINRMIKALLAEGLAPLPVFVASLKDPVSAATLSSLFAARPPDLTLNATSFAAGALQPQGGVGAARPATPLDAGGRPVLQLVLSGGAEAAWEEGARGLSARDIAMNVALPEIDGRVLSRAVSFKGEAYRDEATECPIAAYRARGDRIVFAAKLARAWAALGRKPAAQKRVALVLANYPTKDGRLANGVGLDTPASAAHLLAVLKSAGYGVQNAPADGAALMETLLSGPTNWRADRAERRGGEVFALSDYRAAYIDLPYAFRQQVEARWGPPERDPFVEGEGLPARRPPLRRGRAGAAAGSRLRCRPD